jgi:poly(beta-D-mannuronate) lyase
MYKFLLVSVFLLTSLLATAAIIPVKNMAELQEADKRALPGDMIVLKNGTWNDVLLSLNCQGTDDKPVIFKAETAGKVIISGKSALDIG